MFDLSHRARCPFLCVRCHHLLGYVNFWYGPLGRAALEAVLTVVRNEKVVVSLKRGVFDRARQRVAKGSARKAPASPTRYH